MNPFKKRLIEEKKILDNEIKKLEEFTSSTDFDLLTTIQTSVFRTQLFAMKSYSEMLSIRISWI